MVKRISRSPPRPRAAPAAVASEIVAPVGTLTLDETLDLNAAARLRSALLPLRGADLSVDAANVQHLGAQCAQVLASASATWASDGRAFTIATASEPFGQGARLLGLHSILIPESTHA